jgi:Tripartite tricarboxylate transporter TctB family
MRSDLLQGLAWTLAGGVIVYASWTMDRLERFGAKLYTAPGLVPGILGLVILVLGAILATRRGSASSPGIRWDGTTLLVLALCLGYAIGLIGWLPFWLATFLFVTAFIAVFEYPSRGRMAMGVLYGAGTAAAIPWLFESVFLVRLP